MTRSRPIGLLGWLASAFVAGIVLLLVWSYLYLTHKIPWAPSWSLLLTVPGLVLLGVLTLFIGLKLKEG